MASWSKWSCGHPVIEVEEPAKAFARFNGSVCFTNSIFGCRQQDQVLSALMVPFPMKMCSVFGEDVPERPFAKQDQFGQALLLYRSIPALQMGVQIWTPGR